MADTDAPDPEEETTVEEPTAEEPTAEEPTAEEPQAESDEAQSSPSEIEQPTADFHRDEHEELVDPLRFEQINGHSVIGDKMVDRFDDVPLRIAIELGRVNLEIREILDLKEGSIIETRKLSGQPMEIMVNERLFGRGEVVVVGDNLAIRITDLKKPDLG